MSGFCRFVSDCIRAFKIIFFASVETVYGFHENNNSYRYSIEKLIHIIIAVKAKHSFRESYLLNNNK